MNTLHNLHDAFTTLEERADAAHAVPPDFTVSVSPARPGLTRFAAPAAAAAAVVSVAAGVTVWQSSQHSGHAGPPANRSAAHGPSSPTPSQPTHSRSGRYQPPSTAAELEAKTRAVLGGLATITVDPSRSSGCGAMGGAVPPSRSSSRNPGSTPNSSTPNPAVTPTTPSLDVRPNQTACSGAAIGGTLTSDGRTGGFDLDVFATSPGDKARCDDDGGSCSVHTRPDGSTLAVGVWHDRNVAGGVTYQVQLNRRDGAVILIHLSNESDPKGMSAVTAPRVPLSTDQLTTFVASKQW